MKKKKQDQITIIAPNGKIPEEMILCYNDEDNDRYTCRMTGKGGELLNMLSAIIAGMMEEFPVFMVMEAVAKGLKKSSVENDILKIAKKLGINVEGEDDDDDDAED